MLVSLLPHPDSSGDAVKSIKVEIGRPGPRQLTLRYLIRGTTAAIAMPKPRPPARREGLW